MGPYPLPLSRQACQSCQASIAHRGAGIAIGDRPPHHGEDDASIHHARRDRETSAGRSSTPPFYGDIHHLHDVVRVASFLAIAPTPLALGTQLHSDGTKRAIRRTARGPFGRGRLRGLLQPRSTLTTESNPLDLEAPKQGDTFRQVTEAQQKNRFTSSKTMMIFVQVHDLSPPPPRTRGLTTCFQLDIFFKSFFTNSNNRDKRDGPFQDRNSRTYECLHTGQRTHVAPPPGPTLCA